MTLRVAILGAGPVGLEAALYGATLGYDVTVFEASGVAENLSRWGHVTLLSPWAMNHTPLGLKAIGGPGNRVSLPGPADFLTGREHRRLYLEPLSRSPLLRGRIRERHRVVSVGREGLLKTDLAGDSSRARVPFRMLAETPEGERTFAADVVLDATGSYPHPNWLGSSGIPAPGERAAPSMISYLLDDPLGSDRPLYRGRRILLVGCGLSAASSLVALQRLIRDDPSTSVLWATRSEDLRPYRSLPDDPLPARARLMEEANAIASEPSRSIRRLPGRVVESVAPEGKGLGVTLRSRAGDETHRVDRILANVGYRPDRTLYAELQVHECYASEGPMKLAAALLAGGSTDCLSQVSYGPESLLNPEPGFFILGAKSYGRNSLFLMRIGFEQVRDLFRVVTGRTGLDLYAAPAQATT